MSAEERLIRQRDSARRFRERNYVGPAYRAKSRELSRQYRLLHPDRVREAASKYNRSEKGIAAQRRRYWKKKGHLPTSRYGPQIGESRIAALLKNDIYAAAHRAVPRGLQPWIRDDIIATMILAVIEGKVMLEELATQAGAFVRQHRRDSEYDVRSLDGQIAGTDLRFIDMVTADDLPWN